MNRADEEREELYMESVRRHNASLREEMRRAWVGYHRAQAESARRTLGALVAEHEAAAEALEASTT